MRNACWTLVLLGLAAAAPAQEALRFRTQEIDGDIGRVCYAVTYADVNGDGRNDVVAVANDAVVWYENPTWARHDILRGQTEPDNVSIAAGRIDGDRQVDFVLAAGWAPGDTRKPSTLQWLGRDAEGVWRLHPIRCELPTVHRIALGHVGGAQGQRLIVSTLHGEGAAGPDWGRGPGARVVAYTIPQDPASADWPVEVIDDSLHAVHGMSIQQLDAADGEQEILLGAWEGVFRIDFDPATKGWTRVQIGAGDQTSAPNKGASEAVAGHTGGTTQFVATIEPFHGNQVVAYTFDPLGDPAAASKPWYRAVVASPVTWGHALHVAMMDDDPALELIVGQRDPNPDGSGPGVYLFDPIPTARGLTFKRQAIDEDGMACETLVPIDLDADGLVDVVAGGRATRNVRIYWNLGSGPSPRAR